MNLYVVCLGLWAIFTVYQKEISFFFYFSHRILPFGWFSMKNKSTNTFSETSSLMHLYHTCGVHAIKVWRNCFPSLCPLPAWPAVRLCSSIPAHFTLCVVSEKIGTFYQFGFFNLLSNYFGIAWMAMWEIVISKHKAYETQLYTFVHVFQCC